MSINWNNVVSSFPTDLPLLPLKNTDVYVISNEYNQCECLELLSHLPKSSNGIHMGVSGLQNYSMICQTNAPLALIVDFNPSMVKMHKIALQWISMSDNVQQFLDSFLKDPEVKNWIANLKETASVIHHIRKEADRSFTWLNTEQNFNYIRKLHMDKRILVANVDLLNSQTIQKIKKWMETNGIFCRTLYVSNIPDARWSYGEISNETGEWTHGSASAFNLVSDCAKLNRSIRPLINKNTAVIDASKSLKWKQTVCYGLYYHENYRIPIKNHEENSLDTFCSTSSLSLFPLRCNRILRDNCLKLVAVVIVIAFAILIEDVKKTYT